ncbi:MAG: hypothetical protein WCE49_07045 [Terrimicrobiaceae bacterium]
MSHVGGAIGALTRDRIVFDGKRTISRRQQDAPDPGVIILD